MYISLSQAAGILSLTEDEVMYLHQQNKLKASVNQDNLKWQFEISEVLAVKEILEKVETSDVE